MILRTVTGDDTKSLDLLPSQQEDGVVEQIDVELVDDGYILAIKRTLWTRAPQRDATHAPPNRRGEIIRTETIFEVSTHEAAVLIGELAMVLSKAPQ